MVLIPRCPVFALAVHIGISPGVVRAWSSAVAEVTRQFWLRGQPGPPLRSCIGFPEGCGLSVAAMCLCNLLTHSYLQCRCPRVSFFTCVDNVELLSEDPHDTIEAIEALQVLEKFTEYSGTPIDPRKTYAWHWMQQDASLFGMRTNTCATTMLIWELTLSTLVIRPMAQ